MAFALRMTGAIFSLFFYIMVARQTGLAGTGEFTFALSFALAETVFVRLGMDNVIVRRAAGFHLRGDFGALRDLYWKFLWVAAGASLIAGLAVAAGVGVFEGMGTELSNRAVDLILVQALVPFLAVLLLQAEFLRGIRRVPLSYALGFVGAPLLSCLYLVLFRPGDVRSILCFYVVATALMVVLGHISVLRFLNGSPRDRAANAWRSLVREGLPMILVSSMDIVLYWVLVFMIEIFLTSSEVGLFGVIYRVASVMVFALSAVNSISRTRYAESLHANNLQALRREVAQSNFSLALGSVPLFAFILLFAELLLSVFGEQFVQGSGLLRFLACGVLAYCLTGTYPMLLAMRGDGRFLQNIIYGSVAVALVLSLVAIPLFGLWGAVFAIAVGMVFQNLCAYARRHSLASRIAEPHGAAETVQDPR
ncbi:oligosaccharide flippase family protein [Desulfocurvus sp. DL9XJH121]